MCALFDDDDDDDDGDDEDGHSELNLGVVLSWSVLAVRRLLCEVGDFGVLYNGVRRNMLKLDPGVYDDDDDMEL